MYKESHDGAEELLKAPTTGKKFTSNRAIFLALFLSCKWGTLSTNERIQNFVGGILTFNG